MRSSGSPVLGGNMTNVQKSLYKSISYRIISVALTFGISYFITGSLTAATAIVSIDAVLKMIVYFYHERAWSRIYKKYKTEHYSKKGMMKSHKQ